MRKLYRMLRNRIPTQWHGLLTTLLYELHIKPTVNKKVESPFSKGIVVLSADFEMAWAFRYSKTQGNRAERMGLKERLNVPKLLALFEKYKIPVTWATVGHLFLDSCSKDAEQKSHADMSRPAYFENSNWCYSNGDWYQHDPGTNYHESPAWYAPDLIEQIVTSPVGHEVGCHTFSHIDCSDEFCAVDLLKAELNACIKLASKMKIQLKSMVFPGGTHGNYSILKEVGITCYRKATDFHVDIPVLDELGLVQIPSSYALRKSNSDWPAKRYIKMASSFVKKAKKYKMVAHLWFHPSMDEWYLDTVLPEVLAYIHMLESEGKIEILTMGQVAARVLKIK